MALSLGLGILLVLYLTRAFWLAPIGRFLVVTDPLTPADAVLTLAGDQRRPVHAAELYRRGYTRQFLITQLPTDTIEAHDRYIQQVTTIAMREGVPREAITVVPGVGNTTYEEALNVRRFVEEQGLDSLIVVTSPWHTRRSRIIFREVFQDLQTTITIQPVSDRAYAYWGHTYRPSEWWTYKLGRDPTLTEYLKLAVYPLGIR